MVVARIRGSKVDGRLGYEYCGFAYPGALVGWAWGFNGHGVAQTINALLPVDPQVGRAVSFASRDALQVSLSLSLRLNGLFLYTFVVLCTVEWCIRQL